MLEDMGRRCNNVNTSAVEERAMKHANKVELGVERRIGQAEAMAASWRGWR